MKDRPKGFLANGQASKEILDYVSELHRYLWRVVRVALPGASCDLSYLIDGALLNLENNKADESSESKMTVEEYDFMLFFLRGEGHRCDMLLLDKDDQSMLNKRIKFIDNLIVKVSALQAAALVEEANR